MRTDLMSDNELESVVSSRVKLESGAFELKVIQDPLDGRALGKPEKARGAKWPLDPPPVIELFLRDNDHQNTYLHSPFWFCTAELELLSQSRGSNSQANALTGSMVSSLHKVKLSDNKERGFFIFGDLNVKTPGSYRLKFTLFEMRQSSNGMFAAKLTFVQSKEFQIYPSKAHVPSRESTSLSRTLCEAGVKLRIRKESTKRRSQFVDWSADRPVASAWPGQLLPPPTAPMQPPSLNLAMSHSSNHRNAGESVVHRITYGAGSALGIRDHLNREFGENSQAPVPFRKPETLPGFPEPGLANQSWNSSMGQSQYPISPPSSNGHLRSDYSSWQYPQNYQPSQPLATVPPHQQNAPVQTTAVQLHHRLGGEQQLATDQSSQPQRVAQDTTADLSTHYSNPVPQYRFGSSMESFPGSSTLGFVPFDQSTQGHYSASSKAPGDDSVSDFRPNYGTEDPSLRPQAFPHAYVSSHQQTPQGLSTQHSLYQKPYDTHSMTPL